MRLAEALERAVAAGIISADQAKAVLAAERSREERSGKGRRRTVTEALGYLAGLLTLSGAATLAIQYWQEVPTAGRLGLLAAVAAITWLVGARIRDESAPALVRLRGALWFASSATVAAFAGQLAWDVVRAGEATIWLVAGAAAAMHAALLWQLRDRPMQHLGCLLGVLAAAGGAASLADRDSAIGVAITVAGLAWVIAGWLAMLPPPTMALIGGGIAVLVGAAITGVDWPAAAPLLGLAAGSAFVVAGVGTDRPPLTVVGLIGAFVYLPWTVGHFFADSVGVPLAMLLCGVTLLAITLVLLRKPARDVLTR